MSDLAIIAGNRRISGWQAARLSRGVERCPMDFDVTMTERFPGELSELVVKPGDACQVYLDEDLVLTGYIDRFEPMIDAHQHTIRLMGRSKCEDLVDCAAEWPGGQISGSNCLGIAQKLAIPYGITVRSDVTIDVRIPQFNLMLGETAYDVIERVSRYSQLLAYDEPDGNLLLTRVQDGMAASGFQEGVNVERAQIAYSMDQRFSEYYAYLLSMDVLHDIGNGGNLRGETYDHLVPRHRRHVVIAEAGGGGMDVAIKRAKWEKARRFGRSYALQLTTDGWRDEAGALYAPNTLVPVDLPSLKLHETWLIGAVTYRMDEQGSHADLTIMPPAAFDPEPVLLQPYWMDIGAAPP